MLNQWATLYEQVNPSLYMSCYNYYKKHNIAYILHDQRTRSLIGIDFGDFKHTHKVVTLLERKLNSKLTHLISTHSHYDHTDGNKQWKQLRQKALTIVGGFSPDNKDTVPYADKLFKDNETLHISNNLNIKFHHTPGHMKSSYCFYVGNKYDKMLFTGDTLYVGGCSKVYNGSYKEYYNSLNKIKNTIDNNARIFCGHDFTHSNLKFCAFIDGGNPMLYKIAQRAMDKHNQKKLLVGISTLNDELQYNPFCRCDCSYYKKYTNSSKGEDVLKMLRAIRSSFDNWNNNIYINNKLI